MSKKNLSKGEKKVIAAYDGNCSSTAKKIGMSPSYVRRLLTYDYVKTHIKNRQDNETTITAIADRQERQEFWSSVARGELQVVSIQPKLDNEGKPVIKDGQPVMEEIKAIPSMKDRLRAAELLGKSNADFVERLHISEANKGVSEEITDDMDPKKATNTYLDMVKGTVAGNA